MQRGVPVCDRRQSGVLVVLQLVQMFWGFPAAELRDVEGFLLLLMFLGVVGDTTGVGMATGVEAAAVGGGEE